METMIEHTLEPAVSGPPPRRLPGGSGTLSMAFLALALFVIFFLSGARAVLEAAKLEWIAVSGTAVPARITRIDTLTGPDRDMPNQVGLHYVYSDGARPGVQDKRGVLRLSVRLSPENTQPITKRSSAVSTAVAPVFRIGETLPLRRARWMGQTVLIPWPAHPGRNIAFLGFCGTLILVASISLIYRLWGWASRRLNLLRHGIATIGTITHKHSQAEDAAHYFITYGYGDGQTPPHLFEHVEQVTADQWKQMEIGQPVTVLYSPAKPNVAGLYALLRGK